MKEWTTEEALNRTQMEVLKILAESAGIRCAVTEMFPGKNEHACLRELVSSGDVYLTSYNTAKMINPITYEKAIENLKLLVEKREDPWKNEKE